MSRAVLIIGNAKGREQAARWIDIAPVGTRVEFKKPRRTLPQNARLWAMLTDVARQIKWHDERYTPEEWKLMFMDALNREIRFAPALNGRGVVNLGTSSSDLSVEEMSDMIELIFAFGAEHGVVFQDELRGAA